MANDVAGVMAALVTLAGGVQAFRSPAARRQAWEVIGGLRELDKTILLTTHYLDEAQALADRVAIIAAAGSSPRAPRPTWPPPSTSPRSASPCPPTRPRPSCPGSPAGSPPGAGTSRSRPTTQPLPARPHRWAAGHGAGRLDGLTVTRPSLEDIYLTLTSDTEEAT
jgi:ABC-2 type transport system ATP-binding protein